VAFPTETVYGLGADANNSKAVARIYEVKARPTDHPLIVHISSINQMSKWARDIPDYAITLARKFWPGPITLILKRSELADNFITGGQENVGIRVPSHPVALTLLEAFEKLDGLGIAAPSANRFGAVSPTNAGAVEDELGEYLAKQDLILDGGVCSVGIESTIIDCTGITPKMLRPGFVKIEDIMKNTNKKVHQNPQHPQIKAPGLVRFHYQPKAQVVMGDRADQGDGFLAMADIVTPPGAIRLSAPVTVEAYAQQMYQALRLGDKLKLKRIFIVPPNSDGLGFAIRDRIEKMY
jgi:L-threonylcarbamoyladenylate synthase